MVKVEQILKGIKKRRIVTVAEPTVDVTEKVFPYVQISFKLV